MYSIAIDGPAGAGKSTIAKAIAEDIGFIYVDTGAMYRAIALYFLRKGIDGHDRKLVAAECPNIHVTLEYDEEGKQQVILNGENVTGFIRKEEVGKMASVTSAVPEVQSCTVRFTAQYGEDFRYPRWMEETLWNECPAGCFS